MNMRKLVTPGVVLAAMAAGAVQVSSVRAVNPKGEAAFGEVLVRCEVKPGSEYDAAACARDVRALRDTGEFSYVDVSASKAEGPTWPHLDNESKPHDLDGFRDLRL